MVFDDGRGSQHVRTFKASHFKIGNRLMCARRKRSDGAFFVAQDFSPTPARRKPEVSRDNIDTGVGSSARGD